MTVFTTESVSMPDMAKPSRRDGPTFQTDLVSEERSADNKAMVSIRRGRRDLLRKIRKSTTGSFGRHI
jgi:hypothetical protein